MAWANSTMVSVRSPLFCTRQTPHVITIHQKKRSLVCRAESSIPEPVDARGAIATGLKLTEQGDWTKGLEYFERALELPGTGLKRFRDKPNLISNGEKMAALYNIACCQSRMAATAQDEEHKAMCIQNGLVALAGALEAGYDDFEQIRRDDDFDMLKTSEKFEGLVGGFQKRGQGLFVNLFGGSSKKN